MKTYTIAFSPCPNDTFIFDAMVHQKIDTKGLKFKYILEDVETLNQWALEGKYDISKISYAVLPHIIQNYKLLKSGSALGNGVGPLLITKTPIDNTIDIKKILENSRIAIPGLHTTANFLLSNAFPNAKNKDVMLFSEIEQAVLDHKFDVGLVIHESRFTYKEKGLNCIMDMGKWWEDTTHLPIPLGGIVLKKEIPTEDAHTISELIKKSIHYAWKHYPQLAEFITKNAQEMNEDVMKKHINLYVNKNSESLDDTAYKAINMILKMNQIDDLSVWV